MANPNKIAIHVRTQEQWDEVIDFIRPKDYYNSFASHFDTCIDLKDGCYCSKDWFKHHDFTIISYKEWESLYKHKMSNLVIINVPKI